MSSITIVSDATICGLYYKYIIIIMMIVSEALLACVKNYYENHKWSLHYKCVIALALANVSDATIFVLYYKWVIELALALASFVNYDRKWLINYDSKWQS